MSVDARLVAIDNQRLTARGTVQRGAGGWIAAASFTITGDSSGAVGVQNFDDPDGLVEALIDAADQIVCAAHEHGVLDNPARLASLAAELRLRLAARIPTDGLNSAIRDVKVAP